MARPEQPATVSETDVKLSELGLKLFRRWSIAYRELTNALLGKMFNRIMIHSKNYFSALVGQKGVILCLKIEPYYELNLNF